MIRILPNATLDSNHRRILARLNQGPAMQGELPAPGHIDIRHVLSPIRAAGLARRASGRGGALVWSITPAGRRALQRSGGARG